MFWLYIRLYLKVIEIKRKKKDKKFGNALKSSAKKNKTIKKQNSKN